MSADQRDWRRERMRVRASALFAFVFALLTSTSALAADAGADEHDEIEHWIVSGAFEVGVFGHSGKGRIDATLLTGPRVANPSPQLGDLGPYVVDTERSREDIVSALVGGTLELMTPALLPVPGRPRLFMDFNASAVLTTEVGLARDADPGVMSLPEPRSPTLRIGEGAIVGRGTKLNVQEQGPQFHAGLGTAFTVDFSETRVRIKPSIVYSRLILDVSGFANRAVRLNNDSGAALTLDDYRLIQLSDSVTEVYHGVGPALELEYDTGNRFGPFSLTLFIKGHASYLLGDLKTRMSQTNPDPASPNETVNWKYTQDRWAYRASTGLRLRWDPKSKR